MNKILTKPNVTGLLLLLCFWLLAFININQPSTLNFDEFHYVPAAKAFLGFGPLINFEHPPLGKVIISWGISLFGDNPVGWRIMSTFFGTFTLAAIFFWSLQIFNSLQTASFVLILTATNNLLFVQSRIAMLDTFMASFLIWALFLFSIWYKEKSRSKLLLLSGVYFGLALGIKWFTLIPLAFVGIYLLTFLFKNRVRNDFVLISLFVFSILITYILTYSPVAHHVGYSWSDFFDWQLQIWNGQRNVPDAHPYKSFWWSWPLQLRPMWYHFKSIDPSTFEGVALIGNPLIIWSGFLSVFVVIGSCLKKKKLVAKELLIIYSILLLGWVLVPRDLMFFYYYYPASLILGMLIAAAFEFLRPVMSNHFEKLRVIYMFLSVGVFIHFYPVLSGSVAELSKLRSWAWFLSWI